MFLQSKKDFGSVECGDVLMFQSRSQVKFMMLLELVFGRFYKAEKCKRQKSVSLFFNEGAELWDLMV